MSREITIVDDNGGFLVPPRIAAWIMFPWMPFGLFRHIRVQRGKKR